MSDLQKILQDPSKPLESTLSFLFNAGDAGDTFQHQIFQYFDIRDARNLRIANRRLDQIVKGVPLWERQDGHGNLFYTRNRPADPNVLPSRNSTLHWLGTRCCSPRFIHFIAHALCRIDPRTNPVIKRCSLVPPRLNVNPPGRRPCCDHVCDLCFVSTVNRFLPLGLAHIRRAHGTDLCRRCQLHETRRHPLGYSGCVCPSLLQDGWMCYTCHLASHGLMSRDILRKSSDVIPYLHRDRRGRKFCAPSRPKRARSPCPGCARSFTDRSVLPNHVTYCKICGGVDVKPSWGPGFVPTKVMPVQPVRRSARIADRLARMPPLDFQPIMMP